MSGEEQSYVQSRVEEFEKDLDELVSALKIKPKVEPIIEEALNLSYEQLKNIHYEECEILSYKLTQYSIYLQSVQNRYTNIKKWAENSINIVCAKEHNNYGDKYTKYEEKKNLIINYNLYAKALYNVFMIYSSKEQELYSISQKVQSLSQSLHNIGISKKI